MSLLSASCIEDSEKLITWSYLWISTNSLKALAEYF